MILRTIFKKKQSEYNSKVSELNQLYKDYEQLMDDYEALEDKDSADIYGFEENINELQAQVDYLQRLYNYTPGAWNTIKTFTGSSAMTTELIYVPSNTWRIRLIFNLSEIYDMEIGNVII